MKEIKPELHKLTPKDRLFELSVPLIGLTGSIATGKSVASKFFNNIGCPIICADALVKSIYSHPSSVSFIKTLSQDAVTKDNKIDFRILRKLFFSSENIKSKVESFIYAQIPQVFLEKFKKFNSPKFVIYDVPLLFEKKLQTKFDMTLCIYAKKDLQIERLVKRDQVEESLAKKIIQSQIDIEEKKQLADYFIDNSKSIEEFHKSLETFSKKVFK